MRSPYGQGGTPTNHGKVPARRPRHAYALRSGPSDDGYRDAYGKKPRATRKETVSATTNLVEHVEAPIRKYVRSVTPVTDYANERRIASTINNVQSYN